MKIRRQGRKSREKSSSPSAKQSPSQPLSAGKGGSVEVVDFSPLAKDRPVAGPVCSRSEFLQLEPHRANGFSPHLVP